MNLSVIMDLDRNEFIVENIVRSREQFIAFVNHCLKVFLRTGYAFNLIETNKNHSTNLINFDNIFTNARFCFGDKLAFPLPLITFFLSISSIII